MCNTNVVEMVRRKMWKQKKLYDAEMVRYMTMTDKRYDMEGLEI